MRPSPRAAAPCLLFLLAVALVLGGCGGGSASSAATSGATSTAGKSTPASATGTLTKLQLIADADAICKNLNIELAAAAPKSTSPAEIARVVPRNVALEREALVKLNDLRPPAPFARDWQLILSSRRTLADELAELAKDSKQNDQAAIKALAVSKKRLHAALRQAATRVGFKDCATVGAR